VIEDCTVDGLDELEGFVAILSDALSQVPDEAV
jgi:hypothetical protein